MVRFTFAVLALLLAGCANGGEPTDPASEPNSFAKTDHGVMDVTPTANAAGSSLILSWARLGGRPPNLTGIIVEARPDVAAAPPALVHEFSLVTDAGLLLSTTSADDRGVYRMELTSSDWPDGRLDLEYRADGNERPGAAVASRIEYAVMTFTGGPPDWSETLIE